ncbi:MAG TPA: hypothetical protein VIR79_06820 [Nitrospira sp.]
MKGVDSSAMKRQAVLGLVLLTLSLTGFGQHTGTETAGNSDNFDLDALVDRVSNSKSLGFFTKISLKQDIDRLLESIRDLHGGRGEGSLEQARERYDAMVHKLIILLQDKDKELAMSIDDGRDKLWSILADKKKFAEI